MGPPGVVINDPCADLLAGVLNSASIIYPKLTFVFRIIRDVRWARCTWGLYEECGGAKNGRCQAGYRRHFQMDRTANRCQAKHGLIVKFIVQFYRNFGLTHDIELLLDAAKLLADRSDIAFVFVAAGANIRLSGSADGVADNIVFLPHQPRNMLCRMLNANDVTAITFIDRMLGLSVPSRVYNVMVPGVPIIASAHPASELVGELKASDSSGVFGQSEVQDMADLIRSLASSTGYLEVRRNGDNAHRAIIEPNLNHHAFALYLKALR